MTWADYCNLAEIEAECYAPEQVWQRPAYRGWYIEMPTLFDACEHPSDSSWQGREPTKLSEGT